MGVRDAVRASNGVLNFINRFDVGKPKRNSHRQIEIHLNNILLKYGKDIGFTEFTKNNSFKYKGSFSPFAENCRYIQSDFEKFANWMNDNYKRKEEWITTK